jgi:hypothetical protein
MLQAAVTLLNIGRYRLAGPPGAAGAAPSEPGAPAPGRDLEQARDAIDGVRALLEILERRVPSEIAPLREALSQLQMAYAREAQAPSAAGPGAQGKQPAEQRSGPAVKGKPDAPATEAKPGAGPAEASGRLWVPGR